MKSLFTTNSPNETKALGEKIGCQLKKGNILALIGELGAGKTCFVQGLLKGLGVKNRYQGRSPSFVLINEYFSHFYKVVLVLPLINYFLVLDIQRRFVLFCFYRLYVL